MADSDSSDSDLPSLSERIQKKSVSEPKNVTQHQGSCDSDSGESKLSKVLEKIPDTPRLQAAPSEIDLHMLSLVISSDSEDESEFLNFSMKIRNTPVIKPRNSLKSESTYLAEKVPLSNGLKESNSVSSNSSRDCFVTPKPPQCFGNSTTKNMLRKQALQNAVKKSFTSSVILSDSEDEDNFFNCPENISSTPMLQSIPSEVDLPMLSMIMSSDSEDELEFEKFSEKIRNTPVLKPRNDTQNQLPDLAKKVVPSNVLKEKNSITSNMSRDCFLTPKSPKGFGNSTSNSTLRKQALQNAGRKTLASFKSLSDSEDESEFLNFSTRIWNAPISKQSINSTCNSTSDSDEVFTKSILKSVSSHCKSKFQNSKASSPDFPEKKKLFSNPAIQKENKPNSLNVSSRSRNIPTSKLSIMNTPNNASDSDDEVFSKILRSKPSHCKLKSQNSQASSPDFPEKKKLFSDPDVQKENKPISLNGLSVSSSWTPLQQAYAEEYSRLFLCEPEVPGYFARNKDKIANQLFCFFNKKVFNSQLPKDMPIQWRNSLKSTAGLCHCKHNNGVFSCYIDLSVPLLTAFTQLQDTLIHEMCHAAVYIISKERHVRHGPLWQTWAARCSLVLPFITCPSRCHNYDVNYRFWYFCAKCNWRVGKHKRSAKYTGRICSRCKGPIGFEEKKMQRSDSKKQ